MEYAILDLGFEKLVARYVGSAEAMAFNESVVRESLASLDGRPVVVMDEPPDVNAIQWSAEQLGDGLSGVVLAAGWIREPARPAACKGVPQPDATLGAFLPRDFTVIARIAMWRRDFELERAAAACARERGALGSTSYASRGTWLGVSYVTEGMFIRTGSQIVQLEVVASDEKSAFARALLAAWAKKIGPS